MIQIALLILLFLQVLTLVRHWLQIKRNSLAASELEATLLRREDAFHSALLSELGTVRQQNASQHDDDSKACHAAEVGIRDAITGVSDKLDVLDTDVEAISGKLSVLCERATAFDGHPGNSSSKVSQIS
jgi:hypothetical protein